MIVLGQCKWKFQALKLIKFWNNNKQDKLKYLLVIYYISLRPES